MLRQDHLCFCVTCWPWAGKDYRVALGACLSQHNVQCDVLPHTTNKVGLSFWLDFDLEEVTPATMGWVQHGCCTQHVTTRLAQFSGGQC